MKLKTIATAAVLGLTLTASTMQAQDSITPKPRLTIGGYGEAVYTRNFYSDYIQHKLHMENDIRTGWCRTTPLWGRGLSAICTGRSDRLHDCRAQTVIEAIMWHGNAQSDARYSVEKFRELPKKDRDAVVKFIDAI